MNRYEEHFRKRLKADEELFSGAFCEIVNAINAKSGMESLSDSYGQLTKAMSAVLGFYRFKITDEGNEDQNIPERLERAFRSGGIMYRSVALKKDFYRSAVAPMIALRSTDMAVVALIPSPFGGYRYSDGAGRTHRVNARNADQFEEEAYTFYKPFPDRSLKVRDVMGYAFSVLRTSDLVSVLLAFLFAALVGLFVPRITKLLFSEVLITGSIRLLLSLGILAVCVTVSSGLLEVIKELCTARINIKVSSAVEAATMMRLLALPVSFFQKYNSGDLNSRLLQLSRLTSSLVSLLLSAGLTLVFSAVYLVQMLSFSAELTGIVAGVLAVQIILSVWSLNAERKQSALKMEAISKENGLAFTILSGIEKIRLAGAEKRMFALWGSSFAQRAGVYYHPPVVLSVLPALSAAASVFGTILLYRAAVHTGISVADYYAFNTSYSMVVSAFLMLGATFKGQAGLKAVLDHVSPIFTAIPESNGKKPLPEKLRGNIEFNHVSFSYEDSEKPVINDFSLKIEKGQYVAIVGKSGCGKSTLIRLMLGFEKPQHGAVYYDGHNVEAVDMRFVRRQVGLILQDSRLLHDSIFANIALSKPRLSVDEAWAAAEMAGIAEDIRNMPMKMNTMIGEGITGISGGQKQRLLIARAVAGNPRLLIFDEATSALDNLAQQAVSDMLDKLECTRVVVAHRLSTIRLCDRIIVIENGSIAEDGTYEELLSKQGLFSELVALQQLDV